MQLSTAWFTGWIMPGSQGRASVTNPFLKAEFDKCHGKFRRHATRNPINHHGHVWKSFDPARYLASRFDRFNLKVCAIEYADREIIFIYYWMIIGRDMKYFLGEYKVQLKVEINLENCKIVRMYMQARQSLICIFYI